MSEQGNRRPVLFAVTGLAATIALYLAYHKYSQISTSTASSLHRSNAIRRPRRRWRRGHVSQELDRNPTEAALQNLKRRIDEHQPYGRYDNQLLFTIEEEALEDGLFDLLPGNLSQIHTILTDVRAMTDLEKDKLKFHIASLFVQNFLQEEFPPGWIIGDDVEILVQELRTYDIDEDCVRMMTHYFDRGKPLLPENWDVRDEIITTSSDPAGQSDRPVEHVSANQALEALGGPPRAAESDMSDDDDTESDPGGSQNLLDLLYNMGSEQAKREGFIHRNVQCDSCGTTPIQGIRYHCVNCFDVDLCEDCEAQQVHPKTHIFYKIRIPAPQRCYIKQTQAVIYPGLPSAFPDSMPRDFQRRLVDQLGMDKTEMEASYEQFKCLAGEQIPIENDPSGLGMAISRQNFDMFITPSNTDRPPPPNLIHDRIFAFYDTNSDGVITLDEYITGLWALMNKSRGARLKRMFMAFDLDTDGYVDRRDFLRMFRAYYALSKDLNREMTSYQDKLGEDIRDIVQGSQPISAAFTSPTLRGHISREGQEKQIGVDGDYIISTGPDGVLSHDTEMRGDRIRAIGNAAVQGETQTHPFRSMRQQPTTDEDLSFSPPLIPHRIDARIPFAENLDDDEEIPGPPTLQVYGWPPQQTPETEDIINALGVDIALEDVTDPIDRSRIIHAQLQRLDEESDKALSDRRAAALREFWTRRQFHLDDEEGLNKPPGYTEPDSSDDDAPSIDEPVGPAPQTSTSSRRQSMRSRSSSKVRFDDSAIDTDHETRSNTSSRSIPVNERWGGFELSGPERDIGKEILYQTVQQGFNELLDPLFKKKEDEAMEAIASKALRTKWVTELGQYEMAMGEDPAATAEDLLQGDTLSGPGPTPDGVRTKDEPLQHQDTNKIPSVGPNQDKANQDNTGVGDGPTKPQDTDQLIPNSKSSNPIEQRPSDPTLPQNKPNAPGIASGSHSGPQHDNCSRTPFPYPISTLSKWLRHRAIDEEAQTRGGYGKLSYHEFCRLMIKEANTGRDFEGVTRRPHDSSIPTGEPGESNFDDDELQKEWSSTADFGKMSFMDTWLETAQF